MRSSFLSPFHRTFLSFSVRVSISSHYIAVLLLSALPYLSSSSPESQQVFHQTNINITYLLYSSLPGQTQSAQHGKLDKVSPLGPLLEGTALHRRTSTLHSLHIPTRTEAVPTTTSTDPMLSCDTARCRSRCTAEWAGP